MGQRIIEHVIVSGGKPDDLSVIPRIYMVEEENLAVQKNKDANTKVCSFSQKQGLALNSWFSTATFPGLSHQALALIQVIQKSNLNYKNTKPRKLSLLFTPLSI